MDALLINVILALVEGFALIISPCILPILPIILTGSLEGDKSRPVGIIVGFVITFTIITLFSHALVQYAHLSPDLLRNASYAILIALGVIMVSTYLTEKLNFIMQPIANFGSAHSTDQNQESGFLGGVLFGGLVGIVWSPCAGPILAAVIVQAVVQQTTFASFLVVLAFGVGAGLPMLIIAFAGRRIMQKFNFFRENAILLRKLLGLVIISSVIFLIYYTNLTLSLARVPVSEEKPTALTNALEQPYPAPAIAGITTWINSKPLELNELKGKVVLIDFWTYSCINCIRTLPYLKNWYAKYHDDGFVIIGIHTPEFEFEKSLQNVKNAIKEYGIRYPVAMDNQFLTWKNYDNQYWPAHYLINKAGEVVYQHFGEGEYDVTENNIRFLLGVGGKVASLSDQAYSSKQTPETYLGFLRMENFSSRERIVRNKPARYQYPATLPENHWALKGDWIVYPDRVVSVNTGASIQLNFNASNVYAVMGALIKPVNVKVFYQGEKPAVINHRTGDTGTLLVKTNRLYTMLTLKYPGQGTVELIADHPGLEVYTFTFGS